MYSVKHLASFRGYLKDGQTVQLLKKIKFEEGLLPYPLLLNVSENILIVSDEYTKLLMAVEDIVDKQQRTEDFMSVLGYEMIKQKKIGTFSHRSSLSAWSLCYQLIILF
eukprot:Seg1087.6 transcript_id=Seg1087.6/GoldUCD/mRNA.D3Y31 product="hypothetical protein" protein_id=Seg1087.6/GoldUCD/D3Y31